MVVIQLVELQINTFSLSLKIQLLSMNSDCHLFLRPYLACQARYGDVDQFCHGHHAYPPYLSQGDTLQFGSKRYVMPCIDIHMTA